MTSLRDTQHEQTRSAILDAYLTLAHNDSSPSVSMPDVATAAGVSVRTVYRYFSTKDALQTGAAYRLTEGAQSRVAPLESVNRLNLHSFLVQAWSDFAKQIPAVAAEHWTAAGRELRRTRLADARRIVKRNLPPESQDDETVDLLVALMSSSMFLELVDRMDHSPERAASMATRVCTLLLDDADNHDANNDDADKGQKVVEDVGQSELTLIERTAK